MFLGNNFKKNQHKYHVGIFEITFIYNSFRLKKNCVMLINVAKFFGFLKYKLTR
jgi:hypothetical protein